VVAVLLPMTDQRASNIERAEMHKTFGKAGDERSRIKNMRKPGRDAKI